MEIRDNMKKNLLVAQSGGPTAAINATLAGIIERAFENPEIEHVLGADYGIQGVLQEHFIDLSVKIPELALAEIGGADQNGEVDPEALDGGLMRILDRLSTTPAAALGSCRYKLKDPAVDPSEFERIIEIFKKHNIGYFIYIGGNDSMDTVWKLSEYIKSKGITDITVVGAPKTIDNDLYGIDHCPGFGSAAKYIATTISELERELLVYDMPYVIIVEMMGRNAGWLTAAAALAENQNARVPYLIYLEEVPFDVNDFISDLRAEMSVHKNIIVAISEGIRDRSDKMICDYGAENRPRDAFGHVIASGAGKVLENVVKSNIGCKVRSIELNLLQRCAGHLLSLTDIRESRALGQNAAELAFAGKNGCMSTLRRVSALGDADYKVVYDAVDIREVANKEKKVPENWISSEGNGVTQECIDYLKPLIQGELSCEFECGIPKYVVFR